MNIAAPAPCGARRPGGLEASGATGVSEKSASRVGLFASSPRALALAELPQALGARGTGEPIGERQFQSKARLAARSRLVPLPERENRGGRRAARFAPPRLDAHE